MSAIFSVDAIRNELESTISQAQAALEAFSENASELSLIESVDGYVRELRGIFQILEEPGAISVCEEMAATLAALPNNEQGSNEKLRVKLDALSQSLVILNRFLELLSLQSKSIPSVLLPTINQLRTARGVSSFGEAIFFRFDFKVGKPALKTQVKITRQTLSQLRKFRHMYQAALLHTLKDDRTQGALRYMSLALNRIDQCLGNAPCAPLWWVASGAVEAMINTRATLTPLRKRLFARLDREIKMMIQNAPESFKSPSSTSLVKEFLYLLALNPTESKRAMQVSKHFNLPSLGYNEYVLEEQRQVLFSPGRGVLASVSEALRDDINAIKDSVDQVARGGEFSSRELHGYLAKVADVYVMLGLQSPANVLKNQANNISNWPDNASPSHQQLVEIADVVLYAESALSRLLQGQSSSDQEGENKAFKAQLYEARVVLIDESQNGLALAKRSISAFMDSGGDKLHIANVTSTLVGVRGAFVFLESEQAASLVARSIAFVERDLLESGTMVPDEKIELFADALSSLEFYLEGLLNNNENLDILQLAVHSLGNLEV